jgi:Uma2 family endonuclease
VVSPSNPDHDLETKRTEYARAGIPEYWIVNPLKETITVLQLEDDAYVEHGVFKRGETATSALLEGFAVSVDATLDAK